MFSYRDIHYDKRGIVHLWTWDEEGNRVKIEEPFKPYIYIESSQHKDAVSVYETNLRKIEFPNQFERRRYVEQTGTSRIFYNLKPEQQYLIEKFGHVNNTPDFTKFSLKVFFLDIEVYSPDKFPKAEEATEPINLITVYDISNDMYVTFGLEKPYTPKNSNCRYIQCATEVELLKKFIKFWSSDYPDIVSGWNSEGFDIPYIINRITNMLGKEWADKLSPVKFVYYRESVVQKYGKAQGRWHIGGMNCIDYMEAYKWGSRSERESYNLNYIAEVELGETKLAHNATSLSTLADTEWETFVDYNIQDVTLLKKLEDKLRFLKIIRMIAYMGLARLEVSMGKIAIVSGVTALQALKHDRVISTFKSENQGNYAGGFVKEIESGLREHVVTFDANSLYPNTLISLNLSPETKIGKIIAVNDTHTEIRTVDNKTHNLTNENFKEFLKKEQIAVSMAKVLYTQKKMGIMPELVDDIYKERVVNKNKMNDHARALAHCKKGSDKYKEHKEQIEHLDIMQYTLKILLNSIYGVFANRHSPFYDIDNASSITLTGQAVIKAASTIIDDYAKSRWGIEESITHYNDTDSTHCSMKPILDKLKVKLLNDSGEITKDAYAVAVEINKHLNKQIIEWAKTTLNSIDGRFVFKREAICPVSLYESKKHYILHIKDKGEVDPLPCDTIKYVGVEVAKSTMSKEVKQLIKKVVETIIYTKDVKKTNEAYKWAYEEFKKLPIESIAFRCSINNYDKYYNICDGFKAGKGTPVHCKAAVFYNKLLVQHKVNTQYDNIHAGMKIKWFYCLPNPYNISVFGLVNTFPKEVTEIEPDYEKMFGKIVAPAIDRLYHCVKWRRLDLRNEQACDILEFFKQ
jgi:DNA polymerase elongation subunit (family B)